MVTINLENQSASTRQIYTNLVPIHVICITRKWWRLMSSNERLQCSILFSKQWLISDSVCPFELQNANDIASHIWPGLGMMSKVRQHMLVRFACYTLLTAAWPHLSSPKAFTVSADGPEMYSKRSGKSDWQVFCVLTFCNTAHHTLPDHLTFEVWRFKGLLSFDFTEYPRGSKA